MQYHCSGLSFGRKTVRTGLTVVFLPLSNVLVADPIQCSGQVYATWMVDLQITSRPRVYV